MSRIRNALSRLLPERRYTLTEAVSVVARGGALHLAKAGVPVTEETALRFSAVYACVRVLAESVGSLPLHLYRRRPDGGKERAPEHPLYSLLHDAPNPRMTAAEFRECLQGHLALRGNAFARILRRNGRPWQLWPLHPARVEVVTEAGDLTRPVVYRYTPGPGGVLELPEEDVLHLRGLSSDGLLGLSPLAAAREAVGIGIAAEEYGARLFDNDARPGGVLQHPGKLSEQAYNRLRDSWEDRHRGVANAHKPGILEEGMVWQSVGISPEDAQFLETRKFQVTEVCRIFRVPPHFVGDLERATFSNIEHQGLEFVVHSLRPWLVRWEQAITQRLLNEQDRGLYYAEHLVDGLLRGDLQARYSAYATGRQWGWLSANDVRSLENMNPVEGGDTYLSPVNMADAATLPALPGPDDAEGDDDPTH